MCEKFVFSAGNTYVSSRTSTKFGVHTNIEAERKERERRESERERGVQMFAPIRNEWVLFGLMLGHERGSHIAQK